MSEGPNEGERAPDELESPPAGEPGETRAEGTATASADSGGSEERSSESVGSPAEAAAAAKREDDDDWRRTRANIRTIVGAVLLAICIRIVIFEAFEIDGPSMEPTLLNGDRVVVAKFAYGLFLPWMDHAVTSWGMPEPGHVVIVMSPADDIDIVKRVIGAPGDRIEIRDDVIWRNGEPIDHRVLGPCAETESSEDPTDCEWIEESIGSARWRTSHSLLSVPESYAPMVVPPGHVFVLGDHRDRSNDSRNSRVGMIPVGRVKGRALAIYWSSDHGFRWNRMFTGIP